MFFYPDSSTINPVEWEGYRLLFPTVSVGNVGQLAVDLLLNSLLTEKKAERVGRLNTPALRPVVGPNAFDIFSSAVTTSCEVYRCQSLKIIILQIRSPPFQDTRKLFVSQLTDWIISCKFSRIFILSSSFSQFLSLPDRSGSLSPLVIRYLVSSCVPQEEENQLVSNCGISKVSRVNPFSFQVVTDDASGVIRLPGSGISKSLLTSLELKDPKLPVILFIAYCSEGDNRPEAIRLAEWFTKHILNEGKDVKLTTPISWSKFFGEDIPNMLF